LPEPELHLHGDVVVPDFAGWRRERMPKLPAGAAFELPPDWVCEIASPKTARYDRTRKMRIYAREQIGHLWIVDPLARTLEVFRLEGKRFAHLQAHEGEEANVRAEPFEEIAFEMGRWWAEVEEDR
jgi:Uma2 family endonuclease